MTTDRRQFLKGAAAIAATAAVGCTIEPLARPPAAGVLDEHLLAALADVALPGELGAAGRVRAVADFREWLAGYEPAAEEMHGYGDAEITYLPADPGPGWSAQLAALDLVARKKYKRGFAELAVPERASIVRSQLARVRGERMPAPLGAPHVALALLSHWCASPGANDLAYGATIGRENCRMLADAPRKPLPLAPPPAAASAGRRS